MKARPAFRRSTWFNRKIRNNKGRTLCLLRARVEETLAKARSVARLEAQAQAVAGSWADVDRAASKLIDAPDDVEAIVHATPFLSVSAMRSWVGYG